MGAAELVRDAAQLLPDLGEGRREAAVDDMTREVGLADRVGETVNPTSESFVAEQEQVVAEPVELEGHGARVAAVGDEQLGGGDGRLAVGLARRRAPALRDEGLPLLQDGVDELVLDHGGVVGAERGGAPGDDRPSPGVARCLLVFTGEAHPPRSRAADACGVNHNILCTHAQLFVGLNYVHHYKDVNHGYSNQEQLLDSNYSY